MAVFVELVTDAFTEVFAATVAARQNLDGGRASRAGKSMARRPTRGIETKDDTYAALKIVMSNGQEWPLLDSSSPDGYSTKGITNFILQNVTEQRMEKHQIVETFGDSYVFFFGESPRFLDCSAILVNTLDFNWRAEWWHNYEKYLRGTKLVELGARCYLFWDDNVVEGYMLNAIAAEASEQPYSVTLQFKFFVTKYSNVSLVNVERYPIRSSVVLPAGVELTNSDAFDRLQAYYSGGPAAVREQDAALREGAVVSSAAGRNEVNKITQKIQQLPSSMVVDPDVWNKLMGVRGFATPDQDFVAKKLTNPSGQLRGKIAQNVDEYVGAGDSGTYNPYLATVESQSGAGQLPSALAATAVQESESLENDTISTLEAVGCAADNENSLRDLGLGPNFSSAWGANSRGTGAGIGPSVSFGASASDSVSFSVQANASVSSSAGYGVGASARAGYYANAAAPAQNAAAANPSYQARDPLGNVYGRSETEVAAFNAEARLYTEGAGDYAYGYRSAYGGVGYGKAGYGDFGGKGFGSCNAEGDPGYLDPTAFSNRNVSQHQDAFDAWVRARNDQTAVTSGAIFGATSATGGASIEVTGKPTAFAIVAFEGSLAEWVIKEAMALEGDVSGASMARSTAEAQVLRGPGSFSMPSSMSLYP